MANFNDIIGTNRQIKKCNNPRKTLGTFEFKTFYPKKTIQVTITTPYICL